MNPKSWKSWIVIVFSKRQTKINKQIGIQTEKWTKRQTNGRINQESESAECGVQLSLAGQSVMDVKSYVSRLRENLDIQKLSSITNCPAELNWNPHSALSLSWFVHPSVCLSVCLSYSLSVCIPTCLLISVCLLEKTMTIQDFHDFRFIGVLFYSLAAP